MKKILRITTVFTLLFSAVQSKAQITNGNLSSDWTLTDINGVSQHLYAYLNAGKTVFIDISATWCGPCWGYHNSGALDSIWTYHGPSGAPGVSSTTTNDCVVIFIEGDGTTNSADLHGTGSNTQGDWVTGTNYPIIDPTTSTTPTVDAFNALYSLTYFPTCIMICPDRSMTEVDQYYATMLWAAKASCTAATQSVDAEMLTSSNTSLASCDSVTPTFVMGNVGTSPLTSATVTLKVDGISQKVFNWTGSLATYANTTITGIKVGSASSGTHTITAVVSNPNGGADPTASNNSTTAHFVVYPSVGGAYISQSFESAGIPSNWIVTAGGTRTWDNATNGFNSASSATLNWFRIPSGQVDYLTLTPMSFASATVASLQFDVAYSQYSSSSPETDKLEVQVSTNCGTTWTNKYTKAGNLLKTVPPDTASFVPAGPSEWRHEIVNLTSLAGQSNVLVRFKGTSNYGNNVYIDNVNFSATTGIQENETTINSVNVYPNPLTNNARVDFSLTEAGNVSLTLVNELGQLVLNKDLGRMNAGMQNYSLDAASLSNGLYFLNIKMGNNTITKKVAVNK